MNEIIKKLQEAGDIHSPFCPMNSHGCDGGVSDVDCCDNIRFIVGLIKEATELENKRWIEMAMAHRPLCSAAGNKMLTRMMGRTNRVIK